jgi:hypothetical protein
MKQLKVSLPEELRAKLEAASGGSGKSLADEIRTRVERTFEQDAIDEESRELAGDIMRIADQINRDTLSSWRWKPRAREALAAALQTYLAMTEPPPEGPPIATTSDLFDAFADDPQTLGRAVARYYLSLKAELKKSEQEMRQLHKGDRS